MIAVSIAATVAAVWFTTGILGTIAPERYAIADEELKQHNFGRAQALITMS